MKNREEVIKIITRMLEKSGSEIIIPHIMSISDEYLIEIEVLAKKYIRAIGENRILNIEFESNQMDLHSQVMEKFREGAFKGVVNDCPQNSIKDDDALI